VANFRWIRFSLLTSAEIREFQTTEAHTNSGRAKVKYDMNKQSREEKEKLQCKHNRTT
jgi:hypothetical protein